MRCPIFGRLKFERLCIVASLGSDLRGSLRRHWLLLDASSEAEIHPGEQYQGQAVKGCGGLPGDRSSDTVAPWMWVGRKVLNSVRLQKEVIPLGGVHVYLEQTYDSEDIKLKG